MTLEAGGWGNIVLAVPPRPSGSRWVSSEAADALIRAAYRLGFHGRSYEAVGLLDWFAVVEAVAAGALEDVLSEAIEEQEDEDARGLEQVFKNHDGEVF